MPPTEFTLLAVKCLPRISRIFTDVAFKGVHLPICVDLWNLWENTFSNLFCEFREFCGKMFLRFALLVHLRQVHPLKEPICVDL